MFILGLKASSGNIHHPYDPTRKCVRQCDATGSVGRHGDRNRLATRVCNDLETVVDLVTSRERPRPPFLRRVVHESTSMATDVASNA